MLPLQRCRGSIDERDPALVQALAADRRVILFDSAGVDDIDGEVPSAPSGAARVPASLIESPEPSPADVLGWSMDGMTVRILAK
jgi:hypothetical protein